MRKPKSRPPYVPLDRGAPMTERPGIDEPHHKCPKCGKLHQGTYPSGWCHTCLWLLGERKGMEQKHYGWEKYPGVRLLDDPYDPKAQS